MTLLLLLLRGAFKGIVALYRVTTWKGLCAIGRFMSVFLVVTGLAGGAYIAPEWYENYTAAYGTKPEPAPIHQTEQGNRK